MTAGADSYTESLSDFLRRLRRAWLALLVGAVIGALAGYLLLLMIEPHYEARMIVGPSLVQDTGESLMRFETGAEVIRRSIGLNSAAPADFIKFEQVLREATVAGILSRYAGILEQVGQDKIFRFQADKSVSAQELSAYLLRHVKIQPVGNTESRVISYAHPDPAFAVKLLGHLHTIADETIRQKTAADIEERVTWLKKELNESANPDHREALTLLLLAQERRRMLVAMDQPFAAEIVEPAAASARADWPKAPLMIVAGLFCGLLAGFTLASLRQRG